MKKPKVKTKVKVKPEVKCNWCEWEGKNSDLPQVEVENGDIINACPVCLNDECLDDVE